MICTSHESLVRIVYILTTLGVGGAEKQVIALAERMSARGHAVAIVSLKHAEEECAVKLPVLRLNLAKTPLGVWRGLRFAANFLTLFRPEILHSHTFPANIFTRLLHLQVNLRSVRPVVINTIPQQRIRRRMASQVDLSRHRKVCDSGYGGEQCGCDSVCPFKQWRES